MVQKCHAVSIQCFLKSCTLATGSGASVPDGRSLNILYFSKKNIKFDEKSCKIILKIFISFRTVSWFYQNQIENRKFDRSLEDRGWAPENFFTIFKNPCENLLKCIIFKNNLIFQRNFPKIVWEILSWVKANSHTLNFSSNVCWRLNIWQKRKRIFKI